MPAKQAGSTARIQLTVTPPKKKRKMWLFVDYDNSLDIFFSEMEIKIRQSPELLVIFLALRAQLWAYVDAITRDKDVCVAIISTRQSIRCDRQGHFGDGAKFKGSGNGLCFINFVNLCEERGWTLCKRLYTDRVHNVPSGTAFEREDLDFDGEIDKCLLIEDFFEEIQKMHSDEKELECYLIDDLKEEVLFPVLSHFQKQENLDKVPPNLLLTAVEFNWFEGLTKYHKAGQRPKPGETIVREVGFLRGSRELTEPELKADFLSVLPPGTPRRSPRKKVVFLPFTFVPPFAAELPVASSPPDDLSPPPFNSVTEDSSPPLPSSLNSVTDDSPSPSGKAEPPPRLFCCCRKKKVPVIEDATVHGSLSKSRSSGRQGRKATF